MIGIHYLEFNGVQRGGAGPRVMRCNQDGRAAIRISGTPIAVQIAENRGALRRGRTHRGDDQRRGQALGRSSAESDAGRPAARSSWPLRTIYQAVYQTSCARSGGVCIADEVQTGFGRTGDNFWGFERSGVLPEIVTMAKGIGNGLPLAAVATTSEIAATLAQRLHINTFGGNPLVSAAGLAVLEVLEEEGLQQNAQVQGTRLLDGLRDLAERHEGIGNVRGQGLMIGVELVADRAAKTPGTALTARVLDELKDLGAIVGKGGLYGNVLRIKPPLVLTDADVEFALAAMDEALTRATG